MEDMAKGRLAESIVEELLRSLGFYVIKFGKEHTLSPLTQLKDFVRRCGGKFYLTKEDGEYIYPSTYVRRLPDFVIVDKDGGMNFVEVKYRRDGILTDNDKQLFGIFENAFVIVVNADPSLDGMGVEKEDENSRKELAESRFHVWARNLEKQGDKGKIEGYTTTLKTWLLNEFGIDNDFMIAEAERSVRQFFWIDFPLKQECFLCSKNLKNVYSWSAKEGNIKTDEYVRLCKDCFNVKSK